MASPRSIYIAFDLFPRPKGSSSHIASMVAALAQDHAPVWLLCCGHGDMPAGQREPGVEIFRHSVFHPNLLRRASEFSAFVSRTLARAGKDVEIVVFRDPWGGVPALDAELECPRLFEVNALPSWELPYSYPMLQQNPALRAKLIDQERYCLLASDGVLTVSDVTTKALMRLNVPAGMITCIPNAASDAFLNPRPEACPLPELREGQWFGYVGGLHPWQGVDTAVDAFALAAQDLPDARMLIVHSGRKAPLKALRKRIRKRGIAECVTLQPPMDPEALSAVMAQLAFTVAPLKETARNTVQGCCPVKIIESMATGTPVLASDIRVCRDLVEHGKDGHLVPAERPQEWARAIRKLLKEPAYTESLGLRGRERARASFSWSAIHGRLRQCFAEVGDLAMSPANSAAVTEVP